MVNDSSEVEEADRVADIQPLRQKPGQILRELNDRALALVSRQTAGTPSGPRKMRSRPGGQ